ncbi:MAG: hypothetical protein R3E32_24470 [Chitinophagales bacterium]
MKKSIVLIFFLVIFLFGTWQIVWVMVEGGNLNIYVLNETELQEGISTNIFLDGKKIINKKIEYNIFPEEENFRKVIGNYNLTIQCKDLNLSKSIDFQLLTVNWILFYISEDTIVIQKNIIPPLFQ